MAKNGVFSGGTFIPQVQGVRSIDGSFTGFRDYASWERCKRIKLETLVGMHAQDKCGGRQSRIGDVKGAKSSWDRPGLEGDMQVL